MRITSITGHNTNFQQKKVTNSTVKQTASKLVLKKPSFIVPVCGIVMPNIINAASIIGMPVLGDGVLNALKENDDIKPEPDEKNEGN